MVNRLRPAQFLVQGSPNTPQAVPSTARGQDFANESTKKPPTRLSQSIPEGRLREMQIISQDAPADGTDAPTNRAQDSLTNEAVAVTDVSAPPSNAKIEPHPVPFLNPVGHGLEAGENTLTSTVSSSATATIDNTEPSSMEPKSFNSNQVRSALSVSNHALARWSCENMNFFLCYTCHFATRVEAPQPRRFWKVPTAVSWHPPRHRTRSHSFK